MRLTPALERLAEELALADRHGFSAGPDKIRAWHALAQTVKDEAANEWLPESAFRLRTGASAKWCRRNFPRFEKRQHARLEHGKRVWHVSCRPPRPMPADVEGRVREILESFEAAA